MDLLTAIFGDGPELEPWQMAFRAVAVFVIALCLIRVSGRRSFGQRSPFDAATTVLLGAVLSRGVVGASPFGSTVAAAAVLVFMHRAIGWLSVHSDRFDTLVNGRERVVARAGVPLESELAAALISMRDLQEAVRKKIGTAEVGRIETATLERDGEISIAPRP
jgi:uncharacterized membrane protein YcaP (DUF421 family)